MYQKSKVPRYGSTHEMAGVNAGPARNLSLTIGYKDSSTRRVRHMVSNPKTMISWERSYTQKWQTYWGPIRKQRRGEKGVSETTGCGSPSLSIPHYRLQEFTCVYDMNTEDSPGSGQKSRQCPHNKKNSQSLGKLCNSANAGHCILLYLATGTNKAECTWRSLILGSHSAGNLLP